jgi:hypothetical protein
VLLFDLSLVEVEEVSGEDSVCCALDLVGCRFQALSSTSVTKGVDV